MKVVITVLAALAGIFVLTQTSQASVILHDTFGSFSPDWTVDTSFALGGAGVDSVDTSGGPSGNPYGFVKAAASILNTTNITRTISTAGYNNLSLEFYYKTQSANEQLIDLTEFRWRKNGNLIWNAVEINNTDWTLYSILLPGAVDNSAIDVNFRVRNVLDDTTDDYLFLDDLKLSGNRINGEPDPGPVNPVPEPASLMLLGSGLAGLALRRKKT